jgi:hypothetical protein
MGVPGQLSRPFDFVVVADHSENLGLAPALMAGVLQTGAARIQSATQSTLQKRVIPIRLAMLSWMLHGLILISMQINELFTTFECSKSQLLPGLRSMSSISKLNCQMTH